MLDLALKGYIEIKQEKNEKGKDVINIYKLKQVNDGLKTDETRIMLFLREAAKSENVITLKELEKFIKDNPTKTEKLLKNNDKVIKQQLKNEGIIDEEIQKEYQKYSNI